VRTEYLADSFRLRDIAERRVRLGLLLSEIGRLNNIEVAQDELNRAVAMEARKHPGQEREVFEYFQKSPEAMANLRAPIFEDKVVDFIVEMAQAQENPEVAEVQGEGQEQGLPIGRVADAEELARPILFLASDDASYMVGHNMMVDGGMSID